MVKSYYKTKDYKSQRSIGYLLRRSAKLITSHIESLFVGQDITAVQWIVLMNLRAGIIKTAAEICQTIAHDSGAVTRMLDQLEKHRLITRKRSKTDRRVVELALTPTGLSVTENYLPGIVGLYNHALGGFSKKEVDTLIDLLIRLNDKLCHQPKAREA